MTKNKKVSQSEIDGVDYRKAKLWQIILVSCNALIGMSMYSLIGLASYTASLGFGLSTALIGIIITGSRLFDGITDPLLAFLYDRVNTKFGKIRILVLIGFVLEAIGLMAMFVWAPGQGLGAIAFIITYLVYIIGYTLVNITALTIPPLISNDPRQRPTIGVWSTALNFAVPMILSIVYNVVLLPMFGGTYNLDFLAAACKVTLIVAFVGVLFVCIGVSEYDVPANFKDLRSKKEHLKFKDMVEVLKNNKPLQSYIVAAASDKIAQVTASQALITTMLNGIIIGNIGLATILSVIGMAPAIVFAIFGARYSGKYGSKMGIITWSKYSIIVAIVIVIFFVVIDPTRIAEFGPIMLIYVILTLSLNGLKMGVTTANTSHMSDLVDYELDRSGRYIPAVISGTYSFIDKLISSLGASIAAFAVALVGYTNTVPQPGDESTSAIFWVTIAIVYLLPIIGWVLSIIAMKLSKLDREEMVEVQKRIATKKQEMEQSENN